MQYLNFRRRGAHFLPDSVGAANFERRVRTRRSPRVKRLPYTDRMRDCGCAQGFGGAASARWRADFAGSLRKSGETQDRSGGVFFAMRAVICFDFPRRAVLTGNSAPSPESAAQAARGIEALPLYSRYCRAWERCPARRKKRERTVSGSFPAGVVWNYRRSSAPKSRSQAARILSMAAAISASVSVRSAARKLSAKAMLFLSAPSFSPR